MWSRLGASACVPREGPAPSGFCVKMVVPFLSERIRAGREHCRSDRADQPEGAPQPATVSAAPLSRSPGSAWPTRWRDPVHLPSRRTQLHAHLRGSAIGPRRLTEPRAEPRRSTPGVAWRLAPGSGRPRPIPIAACDVTMAAVKWGSRGRDAPRPPTGGPENGRAGSDPGDPYRGRRGVLALLDGRDAVAQSGR